MIRTASVLLIVSFAFGFVSGLALSYIEEEICTFGSDGNKFYDAVLWLIRRDPLEPYRL